MYTRVTLSLLFTVLTVLGVKAQTSMTLELPVAFATGEFRQDSPGTWGSGITLHVLTPIKNGPLEVGGEFGFLNYGISRTNAEVELGGTFFEGLLIRNNAMISLQPMLRYRLPTIGSKIRPFIDAQAGVRYLYTRKGIRVRGEGERLASQSDIVHWTATAGFGGGLEFDLDDDTALSLRAMYHTSSPADYARRGSFTTDAQGVDRVQFFNSRIDLLTISVGIRGFLD